MLNFGEIASSYACRPKRGVPVRSRAYEQVKAAAPLCFFTFEFVQILLCCFLTLKPESTVLFLYW